MESENGQEAPVTTDVAGGTASIETAALLPEEARAAGSAVFAERMKNGAHVLAALYDLRKDLTILDSEELLACFDAAHRAVLDEHRGKPLPQIDDSSETHPLLRPAIAELVHAISAKVMEKCETGQDEEALQYIIVLDFCTRMSDTQATANIAQYFRRIYDRMQSDQTQLRRLIKIAMRLVNKRLISSSFARSGDFIQAEEGRHPPKYQQVDFSSPAAYRYSNRILTRYSKQASAVADWETALIIQKAMMGRNPDNLPNVFHLSKALEARAKTLERMGQFSEALELLREALKLRERLSDRVVLETETGESTPPGYSDELNVRCIGAIRRRMATIQKNASAIDVMKFVRCDHPADDGMNGPWPDDIDNFDSDRIGACPIDMLVRYAEQATEERKPRPFILAINREIARRRPMVYTNLLIVAVNCGKAGRHTEELGLRIRMEQLLPGNFVNLRFIDELLRAVGEPADAGLKTVLRIIGPLITAVVDGQDETALHALLAKIPRPIIPEIRIAETPTATAATPPNLTAAAEPAGSADGPPATGSLVSEPSAPRRLAVHQLPPFAPGTIARKAADSKPPR